MAATIMRKHTIANPSPNSFSSNLLLMASTCSVFFLLLLVMFAITFSSFLSIAILQQPYSHLSFYPSSSSSSSSSESTPSPFHVFPTLTLDYLHSILRSNIGGVIGTNAPPMDNANPNVNVNSNAAMDPRCLSRSEHSQFFPRHRREASMTREFLAALRRYQSLHKACTMGKNLSSVFFSHGSEMGKRPGDDAGSCQYLVYLEDQIHLPGLGNRLLSLVSAFTYALLTDRVLLIDTRKNLNDLLCEPFGESSWALPESFPYAEMERSPTLAETKIELWDANRMGAEAEAETEEAEAGNASWPRALKLNLNHVRRRGDESFFCEETQRAMARGARWVVWSSNQYHVTELFLMPMFFPKLSSMFFFSPAGTAMAEEGGDSSSSTSSTSSSWSSSSSSSSPAAENSVFTIVGRTLLLPSNPIWAIIKLHYNGYLADARARVGVQVRLHGHQNLARYEPSAYQSLETCLVTHGLLPALATSPAPTNDHNTPGPVHVAVLVAALQGNYARELGWRYGQHPASDGRLVRVHTASEMSRQSNTDSEIRMALAEMWLLAFSDSLATSAQSTFGYVAHGLGAVRPYILDFHHTNASSSDRPRLPCPLAQSTEPCTHFPMRLRCVEPSKLTDEHATWIAAHVRTCQDQVTGLQLVHRHQPSMFPMPSLSSLFGD